LGQAGKVRVYEEVVHVRNGEHKGDVDYATATRGKIEKFPGR